MLTLRYCNTDSAGLFRLVVQSFRLLRRDRLDHRNDTDKYACNAASRRFCTPLRPVAQGIQSNEVSSQIFLHNLLSNSAQDYAVTIYCIMSRISIFEEKS